MTYRLKNTKTGQVGYTVYFTLAMARESARDHARFHGVKIEIVDQYGNTVKKPVVRFRLRPPSSRIHP